MYDVIVIGGGPAGLTAALYVKRAGKSVLVIEKNTYGGQITWSPKVENYPGLTSVSGMEFADRLVEQLMHWEAELELDEAAEIIAAKDGRGKYFDVKTAFGGIYSCRAVIAATGAKPKMLGIEGEERLIGKGISFCAVCDGEFCRGKQAAVVGGGNTALQEALYLSDICEKVYLIHRRDSFRGDSSLVQQIRRKANIEPVMKSIVTGLRGKEKLEGVIVTENRPLDVSALFIAVGHAPENDLIKEMTTLDGGGYADVDESCRAGEAGIFVAGDCRKKEVRQLTTAAADGAVAALEACRYIDSMELA